MQQLSFPLKIHVRKNGLRVIFVEHVNLGHHRLKLERPKQDETRAFCNWIRSTFPDLPTEFKAANRSSYRRRRYDPAERHFVAYDLTPNEFMMIKLAFGFETIKVRFTKQKVWLKDYWNKRRYKTEAYQTPGYLPRHNIHPSSELLARMAKTPDKYRKLTRNRQGRK